MLKLSTVSLLFLLGLSLNAQNFIVSGFVRDKSTGESLINANIYEKGTFIGTISNEYGFFSLSLKDQKDTIIFSFVGYKKQEIALNLVSDTSLTIELSLLSE